MKTIFNELKQIIAANPRVRKASAAFWTTLVGGVGTSLADGVLEQVEVATTFGAALVVTAGVWKVKNEEG